MRTRAQAFTALFLSFLSLLIPKINSVGSEWAGGAVLHHLSEDMRVVAPIKLLMTL